MSKKVLVTGCAGFIGYSITKDLLNNNFSVYGVDSLNDAYSEVLKKARLDNLLSNKSFTFNNIDLAEISQLDSIDESFDVILHLAARAGVRQSFLQPDVYVRDNTLATTNIANYAKNNSISKLIISSTSSVYGDSGEQSVEENVDELESPPSIYAATKISGERIAKTILDDSGVILSIPRFFTVYGPWGRPDMSILRFIYWIVKGTPLRLYGDGEQRRAFTYIDDVVAALAKLIDEDTEGTFNIGSAKINTLNEAISYIEEKLDKKAQIEYLDKAYRDVNVVIPSLENSSNNLNWEPKISLKEGLAYTTDWCLSNIDLLDKIEYLYEGEESKSEN
jgi:nucleoside-diphosphate-sugar epimerase|tara:strand:- start:3072 stop:4076 length:1005 start_codon:yes stop_codon:yes gene_type:complete